MAATLSLNDFMSRRVREVYRIALELRGGFRDGEPFCGLLRRPYMGGHLITTYDELTGNQGEFQEGQFRDWKLKTFVDTFWFQYFEVWLPVSRDRNTLRLNRAYLNVFRSNTDTMELEELVCVHCDPFEQPDLTADDGRTVKQKRLACQFKQGPHLHIKKSSDPVIPHSHFPLNLGHLRAILGSTLTLTQEMRRAAQIVREEVLYRSALRERLRLLS